MGAGKSKCDKVGYVQSTKATDGYNTTYTDKYVYTKNTDGSKCKRHSMTQVSSKSNF
jgi:hypothetical protein